MAPAMQGHRAGLATRASLALVTLLLVAGLGGVLAQPRVMPKAASVKCGAVGQGCCAECPPDTPPAGENAASQKYPACVPAG